MKKYKLVHCLLIAFCLTLPLAVMAQQLVPLDQHYDDGSYTLSSFEEMAIFIGKALLGLSGSFALAMFVWGGIQMIISAGNSAKFENGHKTVMNALIGLAIIFCSYLIINFVLNIVGAKPAAYEGIKNAIEK
jgi:hypothetical protein